MKIRKMIAAILAAAALTCIGGCGAKTNTSGSVPADSETSSGESTPSDRPGESSSPDQNIEVNFTSAEDLVKQMKIGWNLGNTLDATGGSGVDAETSWGNPVTTKAMIDEVKEAGFNVLRLPVSWGTHLDEESNIDTAWLDRVQEVVNYGIDNDMFVILNTHHEEWYMPRKSNLDNDLKVLEKLWQQIAERFKDYGEKLMFEGVNEPRLRGSNAEWMGTAEARNVVNEYAATFVKTVRASGGGNAQRTLFITPYAASSSSANLKALKVPENAGNIIVSVHAYLPYDFALNTQGTAFYEDDGSIEKLMADIESIFLDNGIPVVITEFGSVNKSNADSRVQCLKDFLTAAKDIGVPCVWWDNGAKSGGGENFGLLNRKEGGWFFPEIITNMNKILGE